MEQKVRGLIAYLFGWIGGLIILLAYKDNSKETDFHACQAIVLSVLSTLINIVVIIISAIIAAIAIATNANLEFILSMVGLVSRIVSIGYIVLVILGMIKSYQEQK